MNRTIVALDVSDPKAAGELIEDLAPHVAGFKVGLELITSGHAPEVMNMIHHANSLFFYDGKFCDIPNTVKRAVQNTSDQGAWMTNVHASAGMASLRAAGEVKTGIITLAVTVLTSIDEEECNLTFGAPVKAKVLQFARNVKLAGLDGVICSPKELEMLSKHPEFNRENGFVKVTPGVRPEWASVNDQKRVMTPAEAIRAGADFVVIGRPITDPPKDIGTPLDAIVKVNAEIAAAEPIAA